MSQPLYNPTNNVAPIAGAQGAGETASVSPVVLHIAVVAVTASSVITASVTPVSLNITVPEVTATGVVETYSRENISPLPSNDDNLATTYSEAEKTTVGTQDGSRVDVSGTENVIHQFKDQNDNNTDAITLKWVGQTDIPASDKSLFLQIFNQTSGSWETLVQDSASGANTNITLEATQSTNLSDYYDANNIVSARVYQED